MQQPRGSPTPPTMIPNPVSTRLSRSSTTSSGRYHSRSSLGSSVGNTSGRTRSISTNYTRANHTVASRAPFSKRASTGSHHSLLRTVVGRSASTATNDAGYESDLEDQYVFDAVNTLKMRFNRFPKTPATFRALRIMEQRRGISSLASADVSDDGQRQADVNREQGKPLVEDWSDDYDIPATGKCIVHSESPEHISVSPLSQVLECTNIDTAEQAMHDRMKYEPLVAPVDALSNATDTFFSQGGFTRGSSAEDLSVDDLPDNSLDIEEMMARNADFANATQLLNKTENLDFSTTSFQVWRDVPSSLSIDSFSNSLIITPAVSNDNSLFARAPLQPKMLVRRTPSKLRNVIDITPPEEIIGAHVPAIVFHDATEGSVSPDIFPKKIFEAYPSGAPTLPIWIDSVSFFTALEGPSEDDLLSFGGQVSVGETRNQLEDGTSSTSSQVIDSLPNPTDVACVSDPKLNQTTHVTSNDTFSEHTMGFTSDSDFSRSDSLPHHQLEATVMASPIPHSEAARISRSWSGGSTLPTYGTSAMVLPARHPDFQHGLRRESDVAAIKRTDVAADGLVLNYRYDLDGAVMGPRFRTSTPSLAFAECDFPTIESLTSLPDFNEFSSSVPVVVLEQPSAVQLLSSNVNPPESLGSLDLEDVLLRSLPAPLTRLSAKEAHNWGCIVEVCSTIPISTMSVGSQHAMVSTVSAVHAPSCMDETPPLDGEIFAADDVAGLQETCKQEEEDTILPAPLFANDVSKSRGLSSKDLCTERQDPAPPREVVVVAARPDRTPTSDPQNTSVLVGLGIDDAPLHTATPGAKCPLLSQSSPAISAPHINNTFTTQRLLPVLEPFNAPIPKATPPAGVDAIPDVLGLEPIREEVFRKRAARPESPARRRVSAIERWRQACAKVEMSNTSRNVDNEQSSSRPEMSLVHTHLYRSLSSPPCTQHHTSLLTMIQAVHTSVSRTQSPVLGFSTYKDLPVRKTNGCAHKRRSGKTRSFPKPSSLSKTLNTPTSPRSNVAGIPPEDAGPRAVGLSTATPPARSGVFVENFEDPMVNLGAVPGHPLGYKQKSADASIPPIATPPRITPCCHTDPDTSTLEGWENSGMSLWSPRSWKRSKLRRLFIRPGSSEDFLAAFITPSEPGNSNDSYNPCISCQTPFTPQEAAPIGPTLASGATLAPSRSPKHMRLSFNWIARSRVSASPTLSSKPTTGGSSESRPSAQMKPKGNRLGAVVHKLQSFF